MGERSESGEHTHAIRLGGGQHWDNITLPSLNASTTDNNAAVHRGNAGEKVQFTFTGAFDMQSIDIEAFDHSNATSITGTLPRRLAAC